MCDEKLPDLGHVPYTAVSRRQFAALAAAGAATGFAGVAAAQAAVTGNEVTVRTKDGTCDAAVFYPSGKGSWPGVLLWPDIGGMRQANKDMAKRLAGKGYVVMVVNPFYRTDKAPAMATINAQVPEQAAKRNAARALMTPDAMDRDSKAFVAYLDKMPQTSNAKVGVQGYCMGGALTIRTAAAVPNRVGAACSFHGGNGLVTKMDDSPHLLIGKTNARFLFATAQNDDKMDPTIKGSLSETLYKDGKPGLVDVYKANHGWCVPDGAAYNMAEAERAWATLSDIYKRSLV